MDDALQQALLAWFIAEHPATHTFEEIGRYLGDPDSDVRDALNVLVGDGLVNTSADCYFASRAAVRGEALRF